MISNAITDVLLYSRIDKLISSPDKPTTVRRNIYIPSCDRAELMTTPKLLDEAGLDYKVAVEPRNQLEYLKVLPADKILPLPKDRQGLSYSRNYILEYSKSQGEDYHWQLDDDIRQFSYRKDGKPVKCTAREAMSIVETTIDTLDGVGAAAIGHDNFNYSYDDKPPIVYNTTLPGPCGYFNNQIQARWRDGVPTDVDHTIQLLHEGHVAVLFKRLGFASAPTGSIAGGLLDVYAGEKRAKRLLNLNKYYPNAAKVGYRKNGNAYLMIGSYYRRFRQTPRLRQDRY